MFLSTWQEKTYFDMISLSNNWYFFIGYINDKYVSFISFLVLWMKDDFLHNFFFFLQEIHAKKIWWRNIYLFIHRRNPYGGQGGGALYARAGVLFCIQKSLGNPYLKILVFYQLFVADAKKIFCFTPFQGTFGTHSTILISCSNKINLLASPSWNSL